MFLAVGVFSPIFWEGEGLLVLELHEMIRMLHVVAFPTGFNLLCHRGQQLGVLKMFLF